MVCVRASERMIDTYHILFDDVRFRIDRVKGDREDHVHEEEAERELRDHLIPNVQSTNTRQQKYTHLTSMYRQQKMRVQKKKHNAEKHNDAHRHTPTPTPSHPAIHTPQTSLTVPLSSFNEAIKNETHENTKTNKQRKHKPRAHFAVGGDGERRDI
jgi:hypothetical protein